MYFLADIDTGGFITGLSPRRMVHRESIFPWEKQEIFGSLNGAKKALAETPEGNHPRLIVQFPTVGSGAERMWCYGDVEELVKQRLRIWKGCYGAWELRKVKRDTTVSAV